MFIKLIVSMLKIVRMYYMYVCTKMNFYIIYRLAGIAGKNKKYFKCHFHKLPTTRVIESLKMI